MGFFSFIRENLRWLLGGFLLTFFSSFGQTFFISLSGGEIREAYNLSDGEFGALYMVATLGSAICLTQIGRLVDVVSVSRSVLIVVPVLAVATFIIAFDFQSVIVLGLALFLLRLFGQGMMTQIAMTAMGRWYLGHRGRAISLVTLGHQAGEAILPLLAVIVVGWVGWRTGWMIAGITLLVLALPAIYLLMSVERQPRSTDLPEIKAASRDWTRQEVLRDPLFWIVCIGVLAPPFIGTSIFFHQDYLLEYRGWPDESFAQSFVVMAIFTVTFALISGQIIDRYTVFKLLPVFLLPLSVACFFLSWITMPVGIFVFMGFLGVSYGISSTMFGALWPQIYGVKHLGSIRSIIVAMMVLLTALGPGITGLLIDYGIPFPDQIFWMSVYCFAASIVMWQVSKRLVARI